MTSNSIGDSNLNIFSPEVLDNLKKCKSRLIIFGYNSNNIDIYRSEKTREKAIIDDLSLTDIALGEIIDLARAQDGESIVIVNTLNDQKNIDICRKIVENINSNDKHNEGLFLSLRIYAFGDSKYEEIYNDIQSSSFGCIYYVNKLRKIAMDFIYKYPLANFMNDLQIDYEESLIKDNVDINVLLFGTGELAQELLIASVANNQFLKRGAVEPELKQVKYYIFGSENVENSKRLNQSYLRYKNEFSKMIPNDYLPLPPFPAEEEFYKLDTESHDFTADNYNKIKSILSRSKIDANFIIIAFDSDAKNLEIAKKIILRSAEWNIENLVIFVKSSICDEANTIAAFENCYLIGDEKSILYDIENIADNDIFRMARMRNEIYELEYALSINPSIALNEELLIKNRNDAFKRWCVSKSQLEKNSSIYGCLSIKSKLNLMGLDYIKNEENVTDVGLSPEEYFAIYAGEDMPDISAYGVNASGKPIVRYTLNFPSSRRKNMAIHEHYRWNAFMMCNGMIPSTREEIEREIITYKNNISIYSNGKNYEERRHGNLTTFNGLIEYRKIISERDNCPEAEKDVIKYDYQLLDDAYWLLKANGYKIIKINQKRKI